MFIAILNQSTKVSDADAQLMTQAIAAQAKTTALAWDRHAPSVVFYPNQDLGAVPARAHGITIVDEIPNEPSGVLGFHTENRGGKLWGVVAAGPPLDNGAQILTGDWSVSSILSHEVLEMFIDPLCNLWAVDPHTDESYPVEVCDPVEGRTYNVTIQVIPTVDNPATTADISVANFCFPSWYDVNAPQGTPRDHMGLVTDAFTILKEGYSVVMRDGTATQRRGALFPAWRGAMKESVLSRTFFREDHYPA